MSGQDRYSSKQASAGLLRDIPPAEKGVRTVLLGLMVVALLGLVFGAMWQNQPGASTRVRLVQFARKS